jgi:hypothetical protein
MNHSNHGVIVMMTSREREELRKLNAARGKAAKASIDSYSAVLLADTEERLAAAYKYDDEAWADLTSRAAEVVRAADAEIAERCRTLGIPEDFRPKLGLSWERRGENGIKSRRTELRKVAQTKIAAMARQAHAEIDARVLKGYELLVQDGLETDAARQFLQNMPAVQALMPKQLDIAELGPIKLPEPRHSWERDDA